MFSRINTTRIAARLSQLADNSARYSERAALAIIVVQIILCALAVFGRIMLHADGARMIFGIALGDPWRVDWSSIPTRFDGFLFGAAPAALFAQAFHLDGEATAAVYGFFFYGVPVLQWLALYALARNGLGRLLIFPVLQYVFGTALGFGFPSEMSFAPGFFWICLFCAMRRPPLLLGFALSFAGLVFAHEIAIPAALLVLYFVYRQVTPGKREWMIGIGLATIILWVALRLNAPSSADHNAIFVFDPRKVLNNPTLWLVVLELGAVALCIKTLSRPMTSRALWIIAVVGFALPFLLAPWLNFALGRYEARSLIALSLLLFGAAFMAAARTPQNDGSVSSRTGSALRISVAVALATIVGADLVFLSMWREALGGVKAVTTSATDDTAGMAFVSVAEGGPALSDRQRRALVHLGFGWTWPLLSIDIAPGYRPQAVLFDPAKTDTACRRKEAFLSPQNSLIPEQVRLQLVTFSCAHPPPPRPATKSERFFSKLRTLFQ